MTILRRPKRFRGKKVSVTFSLPEDLLEWITAEAGKRGVTRSDIGEDLLEYAIDEHLKEAAASAKQ